MFFIILLSILISISMGIGYFVYKKNLLINKPIPEFEQNIIAKELEALKSRTFNYQVPTTNVKNQSSPTSSQIQQNQLKTIKQLNINPNYLIHYQNSINYLNQISNTLKNLQQTLVEIENSYNNKNYLALPSLISKASDENSNFIKIVSDLKNSLNDWSTINQNTTDELIKSKTNQVIEIGFSYTQSSLDFSKSTDKILAYKGIGDFNKLSKEFQEAAQKMETDGKNLNKLIDELNSILNK